MTLSAWQEFPFSGIAYRVADVAEPGSVVAVTPYIALENIDQQNLHLNSVSRADQAVSGKIRFESGDVLFGKLRPYFRKVVHPRFSGVCSTDIWVLRPRQGVDQSFLFYTAASQRFVEHATRGSTGTKMPRADWKQVSQLAIPLPPLPEQREIARILGALDDKIELNRRMNATLEAMARALFQSWFVDFDPVHAKAEGRQPVGMDAETAALFPDSFEDSELGPIPKGWKAGQLSELVRLNPETWSNATRPARLQYVDLSNTKWGRIESITSVLSAAAPSRAQRVLRTLDTIIGTVRPGNGSYALVTDDGLTGSTGFAVLRPLETYSAEFVYLTASSSENINMLTQLADGGAYPAVRPEVVAGLKVAIPSANVLSAFSARSRTLFSLMSRNEHQSELSAKVRDQILPKLLSGELRVRDVAA